MKSSHYMIAALILMIFGEILTIYSEVYASKLPDRPMATPINVLEAYNTHLHYRDKLGICILARYRATGNIWVVRAASLTPLLILEPIVIYATLKKVPERGAPIALYSRCYRTKTLC